MDHSADRLYVVPTSFEKASGYPRTNSTEDPLPRSFSVKSDLSEEVDVFETPMSFSGHTTPSALLAEKITAPKPKVLHLALQKASSSKSPAIPNRRSSIKSPKLGSPPSSPSASPAKSISDRRARQASFSFYEEPAEMDDESGSDETQLHEVIEPYVPIATTSRLPPIASSFLDSTLPSSPQRSHSSPALCTSAPTSPIHDSILTSPIGPASEVSVEDVVILPRQLSDSALVQSMSIPESGLPTFSQHRNERRYRALLELVCTEEGYLQDLRIMIQVYFDTLAFLPASTTLHNSAIRRNADELLVFHERLLQNFSQVEERLHWRADAQDVEEWDDSKVLLALRQIADVILVEADNLKLYEDFCAKHTDAMTLLRQYESNKIDWEPYQQNCAMQIAMRFPSSVGFGSRLRIRDYAIKPIQRICRYPMMLAGLEKLVDVSIKEEAEAARVIQQATEAVKLAAEAVDAAKVQMEVERKSAVVARRLEVPTSIQPTFLSVLGYVHMIGALYLISPSSQSDNSAVKVKYYGAFLYTTHLVLVKVRRVDCYEPRHWLPLRAFDVEAVPEDGALPFSFRLVHGDQKFEFAATGAAERSLWVKRLSEASAICREAWDLVGNAAQHFDETTISSIPVDYHQMPLSPDLSGSAEEAALTDDEEGPTTRFGSSAAVPFHLRSRLSQSTLTFLGRTPSATRATIDSRLSDVFSDECLTARAAHERNSSPDGRTRSREHKRQQSAPSNTVTGLTRRSTTKEPSMGPRRKSFADTIKPKAPEQPQTRRLSIDIPIISATDIENQPPSLGRSKTTGAVIGASNSTQVPQRQSWRGTLRMRTKSMLGSPSLSDDAFMPVDPASVERNGSHSSSGSSHPSEIHTPALSPASTAPPSPIITPQDGHWGGLRSVLGSLSRRSSFSDNHRSRLGPTLGSAEQDAQAIFASDFLYGEGDKPVPIRPDGWRSKRNSSSSIHSSGRQSSTNSLLSIFRPSLSPTLPSPSFERPDPMDSIAPPVSTELITKAEPSLAAVNDVVKRGFLNPGGATRKKSIRAFRQLVRMTTAS